jgi:hypothetical protein
MPEQVRSAERPSEPQANGLTALLAAFVDCRSMAHLDHHDDEFVFADFIDDSVNSLSNPIPFLRGKLYAPFSAWIITQCLNPLQNASNILFWDAP